jgi:hypothetical protein
MRVNVLVEGIQDEAVAKKLLMHMGLEVGTIYGRSGKSHLLKHTNAYNKAAHILPWFVLVDLDMDAQCPSQALTQWLPDPAAKMRFRIAVRSVEAWLLADRESIAKFLAVSPHSAV